jgi:hypothetical protein
MGAGKKKGKRTEKGPQFLCVDKLLLLLLLSY